MAKFFESLLIFILAAILLGAYKLGGYLASFLGTPPDPILSLEIFACVIFANHIFYKKE